MATYLVGETAQAELAKHIDAAVRQVLQMLPNHGNEEGVTPVLGQKIAEQSFRSKDIRVEFNYRQANKWTEEPYSGADGGFLVRILTPDETVKKASLFQAKLLKGSSPVRTLSMTAAAAEKFKGQVKDMLKLSDESVGLFYTEREMYVVDAEHYRTASIQQIRRPLSEPHRLITLGTYLGRWMSRCTRGDLRASICSRVEHLDGLRHGINMSIVSSKPSIRWSEDRDVNRWRHPRK